MTLFSLIKLIKDISLKQPNVRSFGEGNIYDFMNANPSIEYDVVFLTQGTHTQDETFDHYNFTIFYTSRLQSDLEDNRLQIQSAGKEIISNIIRTLREAYDIDVEMISFTSWTQKFSDENAGVYAQLIMDIPIDFLCYEEYE